MSEFSAEQRFPADGPEGNDGSTPDETSPVVSDDGQAWRQLFQRVEPALRRFLAGKLPQTADVDDCVQRVFVAMLQNETHVPVVARRAWLFRVAANEAAYWWRQKASTDRVTEKHAAYLQSRPPNQNPDPLENRETVEQIQRSLQKLPQASREIVLMRLRDEMTFQAIADQLNVPLGTVLTRMRRAMQRLRDELQEEP